MLREATRADVARLAPELTTSGRFEDEAGIHAWLDSGSWRVRLTERDEIVLVDRWREHLPYLAIEGLWCEPSRVPALVDAVVPVARQRGLTRLLSPLVTPAGSRPYQRAGMEPYRHVRQLRRSSVIDGEVSAPWQVEAGAVDPAALLALETDSFDEFWRLDAPTLTAYLATERATWVRDGDRVLAYALSSARGTVGSVGRLTVDPAWARRGLGRTLLREAARHLAGAGVRELVVNTQAENVAALGLYRSEGFLEMPERLVMLVSATL